MPDGSAYVDTSDRADWLDQAIDELMNAGYVDIFHWERGGGRWTRVSYPRDFRSDREPVARVIRRVMRERGIVARARAR